MSSHHSFPVAVHLAIFTDCKTLLLRRFNTGWEDGKYSVVAGHVEAGESARAAMAREAKEEVGISVDPARMTLLHVMHRRSDSGQERIDLFFTVADWEGEPTNAEPGKCDELRWADVNTLPDNTVAYVRAALGACGAGELYSEHGW